MSKHWREILLTGQGEYYCKDINITEIENSLMETKIFKMYDDQKNSGLWKMSNPSLNDVPGINGTYCQNYNTFTKKCRWQFDRPINRGDIYTESLKC
jgi:hypothetical protein